MLGSNVRQRQIISASDSFRPIATTTGGLGFIPPAPKIAFARLGLSNLVISHKSRPASQNSCCLTCVCEPLCKRLPNAETYRFPLGVYQKVTRRLSTDETCVLLS